MGVWDNLIATGHNSVTLDERLTSGFLQGIGQACLEGRRVNHGAAWPSPVHGYVNPLGNVFFQLFNLLGFSLFCCQLSRSICFFVGSGCKERCSISKARRKDCPLRHRNGSQARNLFHRLQNGCN